MNILVDADACPVKESILHCAKKYGIPVLMVCDVAHLLSYEEPLVTVLTVDQGADSADLVLANRTTANDICVTQDYGLAALLLAKGAIVLHPDGFFYRQETIDRMLFERHISRELRRKKKGRSGQLQKRTKETDMAFSLALEQAITQNSSFTPKAKSEHPDTISRTNETLEG